MPKPAAFHPLSIHNRYALPQTPKPVQPFAILANERSIYTEPIKIPSKNKMRSSPIKPPLFKKVKQVQQRCGNISRNAIRIFEYDMIITLQEDL